jgi:hypothetical protein
MSDEAIQAATLVVIAALSTAAGALVGLVLWEFGRWAVTSIRRDNGDE